MLITQKSVLSQLENKPSNHIPLAERVEKQKVEKLQQTDVTKKDSALDNINKFQKNVKLSTFNIDKIDIPNNINLEDMNIANIEQNAFKAKLYDRIKNTNSIIDYETYNPILDEIVNSSALNIDTTPTNYNTNSNLSTIVNSSPLNIDFTPPNSATPILYNIVNSSAFNIDYLLQPTFTPLLENIINNSALNIDYLPLPSFVPLLDVIVNNSAYNIDTVPPNYNVLGNLNNSFAVNYGINGIPFMYSPSGLYYPEFLGLPNVFNTSVLNIDGLPITYNQAQFLAQIVNNSIYNIDVSPQPYNQSSIISGLQSMFGFYSTTPTTVNYFSDDRAIGFTAFQTQTNFIGINGNTFTYNNGLWNVGNFAAFPNPQNYFNDLQSGAYGFTTDMYKIGQSKKPSQFIGINGNTYNFPTSVISASEYTTVNIPNSLGTAFTPNSQLGTASTFTYFDSNDVSKQTEFTEFGYSNLLKYSSIVNTDNSKLVSTAARVGALEAIYGTDKYDKTYYNTSFVTQPFIKKEIGKTESINGFDMFIRGGGRLALQRSIEDTQRISLFLQTPKGIAWQALQFGLGKMNPKVDSFNGEITRTTRQHFGINVLKTIPIAAFGGHAKKHGLFEPDLGKYSLVAKYKPSRLIGLQSEIFEGLPMIGSIISSLSGFGGAQSNLGIGETFIRRYTDTRTDATKNAAEYDFIQHWSFGKVYAQGQAARFKNSSYFGVAYDNVNDRENSLRNRTLDAINKDTEKNPYKPITKDSVTQKLIDSKKFETELLIGTLKPNTGHDYDVSKDTNCITQEQYDDKSTLKTKQPTISVESNKSDTYSVLSYNKIPTKDTRRSSLIDFRDLIQPSTNIEKAIVGKYNTENYYQNNNLENRYGFGKSISNTERANLNPNEFLVPSDNFKNRLQITQNANFRGDKINAIDIGNDKRLNTNEVYPNNAQDLIEFYFEDGDIGYNSMPFRCTMTSFTDTFSPSWTAKEMLGRPDKVYLYDGFERQIGFSFKVHAMSRSEMLPMWRKINYLASYTMPDYKKGKGKPSAPFMRITIGHLFQQTPGFINSLSYTIPDDVTWDIAEDRQNPEAKQLPMGLEISVGFTIVSDFRPQLLGRVYSLSPKGTSAIVKGQWLADSKI